MAKDCKRSIFLHFFCTSNLFLYLGILLIMLYGKNRKAAPHLELLSESVLIISSSLSSTDELIACFLFAWLLPHCINSHCIDPWHSSGLFCCCEAFSDWYCLLTGKDRALLFSALCTEKWQFPPSKLTKNRQQISEEIQV